MLWRIDSLDGETYMMIWIYKSQFSWNAGILVGQACPEIHQYIPADAQGLGEHIVQTFQDVVVVVVPAVDKKDLLEPEEENSEEKKKGKLIYLHTIIHFAVWAYMVAINNHRYNFLYNCIRIQIIASLLLCTNNQRYQRK